jgi:hypothetical protein
MNRTHFFSLGNVGLSWLIVAGLLISSLGCVFVTERLLPSLLGDSQPSVEPASEAYFRLTVENRSPYDICYIHISPSDAEAWGDNWLSSSEVIETGAARTFEVPTFAHDVLVLDCDRAALASTWEVRDDTTLIVGELGKVPLRLVNDSDVELCYVFIADSSQQVDKRDDRLGLYESIAEGETRIFFLDPGTYDMLAVDCDGEDVAWQSEVSLVADEVIWHIEEIQEPWRDEGSGEAFTVRVENETPYDICYVHISPARSQRWGDNWLGEGDEIAPGASRDFEVPGGAYDILVVDCDGAAVETAWGISETITLNPGSTGNVAFTVVNESGQDICYVYISPASADLWGESWLGSLETIPPQEAARVFYVSPDTYDIDVHDCDGQSLFTEYNVEMYEDLTRVVSD